MNVLKQLTNEELVAEMEAGYQHLNRLQPFTKEHREIMAEIRAIREEILKRMNKST